MPRVLKTVVFMGSSRDVAAPWGGDKRLGDRVLKHVLRTLRHRKDKLGSETITHDVTVFDPVDVFGKGGALADSGGEMRVPHFFLQQDDVPPALAAMAEVIKAADCYLVVSPEYNHTVPPALSGLMGHFGGSNYAFKPSGIITYSPSPWGGMRVAVALRPMLSELGCLPVSKLCAFPSPADLFDTDGKPLDKENRMLKQLPDLLAQVEWMAIAMANQRAATGTP